jgi:hypothetical protein
VKYINLHRSEKRPIPSDKQIPIAIREAGSIAMQSKVAAKNKIYAIKELSELKKEGEL